MGLLIPQIEEIRTRDVYAYESFKRIVASLNGLSTRVGAVEAKSAVPLPLPTASSVPLGTMKVNNVKDFGNVLTGTGKQGYTGSLSSGSNILTLSTAQGDTFDPANDVGKNILIRGADSLGIDIRDLLTTIASIQTPTSCTLAASSSFTVPRGEVFWWHPSQDDTVASQNAINKGDTSYFQTGVYVLKGTLTYDPRLRRVIGDGRRRTTILQLGNVASIDFRDSGYLKFEGIYFVGPGINGPFGGQLTFLRTNNDNIPFLRLIDIEVEGSSAQRGIFVDTPILSTFENCRAVHVVGNGIELKGAVACDLIDCYGITTLGAGVKINGGAAIGIQGCAAEVCGINYNIQGAFCVKMTNCDSETPIHRISDAPAQVNPTATAGTGVPAGSYWFRFTWLRRFSAQAFDLESKASPSSTQLTLTAGNQTINATIPARPTDVPNITVARIYMSPTNGGAGTEGFVEEITVGDTPTNYTRTSVFTPGAAPPLYSGRGHHIVVDNCQQVTIDTPSTRSVDVIDGRYLLVTGSSQRVTATNFRRLQGAVIPTFSAQIDAGCGAVQIENPNFPTSEISDAQGAAVEGGYWRWSGDVVLPRGKIIADPGPLEVQGAAGLKVRLPSDSFSRFFLDSVNNRILLGSGAVVEDASIQRGAGGELKLAPGGTNQNITLTPSGTGFTILNGSVGIGTTGPDSKLEVDDNIASTATSLLGSLKVYNANTSEGNGAQILFRSGEGFDNNRGTLGMFKDGTGSVFGAKLILTLRDSLNVPQQRLTVLQNGNVGIGTTAPKAVIHGTGSTILGAATAAAADADLGNSQVSIWVDEVANKLKFKVKKSGGVIASGEVALV